MKRFGHRLLPSSKDRLRETLQLLSPWDAGVDLVRFGQQGDGGYLVPSDFEELDAVLSPGVAHDWSFEAEIGDRLDVPSYMIDGSVDQPMGLTPLQHFDRLWLGARTRKSVISLQDWVAEISKRYHGDLLLQMDIEGAEYGVFNACPLSTLRRFRTIVVEYHGLEWIKFAPALKYRILPTLRKLSIDFEVVHVHPNNCCGTFEVNHVEVPRVLEVTYLRRDRLGHQGTQRARLPHPLDRDCVEGMESIRLPEYWPLGVQSSPELSDE